MSSLINQGETEGQLARIADALERLSPKQLDNYTFDKYHAYLWKTAPFSFLPIAEVNCLEAADLVGIDSVKKVLLDNTRRFAQGFSANNALLWGARGMGKSSLVKTAHAQNLKSGLILLEIQREDLKTIDILLDVVRKSNRRFIVFCDDLSFSEDDAHYKSLKAVLDGGIQGTPENVLLYATSNRRHLMPRDMIDNEQSSSISPGEAVEEKVSLSDRFGIWLGFHSCSQKQYIEMIRVYVRKLKIDVNDELLLAEALEWQQLRGARSGRVAWQYILDLAGRHEVPISTIYNN